MRLLSRPLLLGGRDVVDSAMTSDDFYSSMTWRRLRHRALVRAGFRCELCRADLHLTGSRVDHIRSRREAPALQWDLGNLRALCPGCDNARHAEKGHGGRRIGCDELGRPLDPRHSWRASQG